MNYVGKPTAIVKPCNPTITDALEDKPDTNSKPQSEEPNYIKAMEHQMPDSLKKGIFNKHDTSIEFKIDPFNKSVETEIDNVIPTLEETNQEVQQNSNKIENINSSFVEQIYDNNKGNIKITIIGMSRVGI